MTKREYCLNHDSIGYVAFSMCTGISVHGIEYGINDYVYYQYERGENITFHKSTIRYTASGKPYFMFNGCRIHFDEIMRY